MTTEQKADAWDRLKQCMLTMLESENEVSRRHAECQLSIMKIFEVEE